MKRFFTFKKISITVVVIFLLMQFIRIDTQNPPAPASEDFIQITKAPKPIADLLKRACYDCHSNTTAYPWYSQIAPVSWWLKDHVDEAREELNFSAWNEFSGKEKAKKLKHCAKEVQEGEMPLNSYTWVHTSAKLNDAEKKQLQDFFLAQMSSPADNSESHEEE